MVLPASSISCDMFMLLFFLKDEYGLERGVVWEIKRSQQMPTIRHRILGCVIGSFLHQTVSTMVAVLPFQSMRSTQEETDNFSFSSIEKLSSSLRIHIYGRSMDTNMYEWSLSRC